MSVVAVTGSTGHIGGLVARALADAGVEQRLLARSPDRAPQLPGATVVASAYADEPAVRRSLEGVDVLFMVSASESPDRLEQHRAFVDAAAAASVGHVVYLSFYGAAPDATFTLARDHWATEEHLRGSGMAWTVLRDAFYQDVLPEMAGEEGVIRGPAGDGRFAPVARIDVARVATTVLRDAAAHAGRVYAPTGPDDLTMAEVAAIITSETGREVTFHDETIAEAYESRKKWAAEQWEYDAWVSTYTAIAAGEMGPPTDDVRAITGQEPVGLAALLRRR